MSPSTVDDLVSLLQGRKVCILTGAGISTASGIPDYRGPLTRQKARNPIQHRAFVTDAKTRVRYWARSLRGWPRFRAFEPNLAHHALRQYEAMGLVTGLLTQNVDRLHHKAGSTDALELHGALQEVRCLECGAVIDRDVLQDELMRRNPGLDLGGYALAPDGDADIPEEVLAGFEVAPCGACGGVLKPDVVFFGDNVPKARVERAYGCLDAADALVVAGSSLAVFSGYRFVVRAKARGIPVALVNLGESRADGEATVRVEAPAEAVLPALVAGLNRAR